MFRAAEYTADSIISITHRCAVPKPNIMNRVLMLFWLSLIILTIHAPISETAKELRSRVRLKQRLITGANLLTAFWKKSAMTDILLLPKRRILPVRLRTDSRFSKLSAVLNSRAKKREQLFRSVYQQEIRSRSAKKGQESHLKWLSAEAEIRLLSKPKTDMII